MDYKKWIFIIFLTAGIVGGGFYLWFDEVTDNSPVIPDKTIQAFVPSSPILRVEANGLDQVEGSVSKLSMWNQIKNSRFYDFIRLRLIPLMRLQLSGITANNPIPAEQIIRSIASRAVLVLDQKKNSSMKGTVVFELGLEGNGSWSKSRFDQLYEGRVVEAARRSSNWSVKESSVAGQTIHYFSVSIPNRERKISFQTSRVGNFFLMGFGDGAVADSIKRYLKGDTSSQSLFEGNQRVDQFRLAYRLNGDRLPIRRLKPLMGPRSSHRSKLVADLTKSTVRGHVSISGNFVEDEGRIVSPIGNHFLANMNGNSFKSAGFMPDDTVFFLSTQLFSDGLRQILRPGKQVTNSPKNNSKTVELGLGVSTKRDNSSNENLFEFHVVVRSEDLTGLISRDLQFISRTRDRSEGRINEVDTELSATNRSVFVVRKDNSLIFSTDRALLETIQSDEIESKSLIEDSEFRDLRGSLQGSLNHLVYWSSSPLSSLIDPSMIQRLPSGQQKLINIVFGFNPYREMSHLLDSIRGNIGGAWWDKQCKCLRYKVRSSGDFVLPLFGVTRMALQNQEVRKLVKPLLKKKLLRETLSSSGFGKTPAQ